MKKIIFLLLIFFASIGLHSKQDYFTSDKKFNHDIIAQKAKRNKAYAKLLDISKKYNLVFCIRKCKIGYRGKTQNIRRFQGQYRYKFLTSADDPVLDKFVESFVENFEIFSPKFIKKSGLRALVFARDITFANIKVGGGFEMTDSVLYINIPKRFYTSEYTQYIIYHEFFHLLQNRFPYPHEFINYKKWRSLNAPGVKYYPGGALAMLRAYKSKRGYFFQKPKIKGFVTQYGRTDYFHDPTEIFCCLFIESKYSKMRTWMKSDRYLRRKVDYLLECLNRISPVHSLEYFDTMHADKSF